MARPFQSMPEEQQDTVMWIGSTLMMLQSAESILATALVLPFHPKPVMSLESLDAAEEDVRRKTVGQLLHALRRRAEIHPDLESRFMSFLKHRNHFIHTLSTDPSFDMESEEGRERIVEFLAEFLGEILTMVTAFTAAIISWTRSLDVDVPFPPGDLEGFAGHVTAEIENAIPAVQLLIRRKHE